ncbi:hypothetical protein [Zunongwangia endophytica]|uniref:DUF4136 domain-containing protein n=1 Tax=Zunongwangia endophytica TaxID=1808945 RepID=A0ABV8H758_9FLAO|nr:hypothetical protein [Zunongwangia endophytica]MDN3595913.1 hypothetical protein [Zunongwangia endophytica]
MKLKFVILAGVFLVLSCRVTTHSVPDIEGSRIVEDNQGLTNYLFQTKLQRPTVKTWFKQYLNLEREDDLVRSKVILFPELEKEFLITVEVKDDREVYTDIPVAETFFNNILGHDDESDIDNDDNTGLIKFFVNIQVSDIDGVDHIATSSLYSSRIRSYLEQLEYDFFEYQKNFKALP